MSVDIDALSAHITITGGTEEGIRFSLETPIRAVIEAAEAFPILGEIFREHFNGRFPAQLGVPRKVRFPHAARAKMPRDFKLPELSPRRKRHDPPSKNQTQSLVLVYP